MQMISKAKAPDFLSVNITPVASHWCRLDFWVNTDLPADNRLGNIFSEDLRS